MFPKQGMAAPWGRAFHSDIVPLFNLQGFRVMFDDGTYF
jgi:hypothetical protein